MTDFDANDDPLRLTGTEKDDPFVPAELRPRFAPRARQLAYARCFRRSESGANRIQSTLDARSRRAARCACPHGRRVAALGFPPRRSRRLWTKCHGRAPGSPS
jgi:hypothetical protein